MKTEQAAFAKRFKDALKRARVEESPKLLGQLLSRYGGTPVTSQAISGWLSGKHMPKQANMRALAEMLDMDVVHLQYGKSARSVREPRFTWPDNLGARDRLLFEEFLALPATQREAVRHYIETLADASRKSKTSNQ